jgi:hypothetical protein
MTMLFLLRHLQEGGVHGGELVGEEPDLVSHPLEPLVLVAKQSEQLLRNGLQGPRCHTHNSSLHGHQLGVGEKCGDVLPVHSLDSGCSVENGEASRNNGAWDASSLIAGRPGSGPYRQNQMRKWWRRLLDMPRVCHLKYVFLRVFEIRWCTHTRNNYITQHRHECRDRS